MLSRRSFLSSPAAPLLAQPPARPNLVLFLSDDHGYFDSPVFGSPAIRTPNLERLAAAGSTFTHTFSGAAICIPSRAIIASGLCSHRNGAIANGREMTPGIKTLPSYLAELGYHTAHFGKSHFLPRQNYSQWEAVPSEIRGPGPLNNDLDTGAFDRWLASRNPATRRPLCLIVCSHSPHVNWETNRDYDPAALNLPPTSVDTPEARAARANYYTDITKMDQQLGEVYSSVQRRVGANTLFVYTSDNGAQWPFGKWNLYDAGIRLPMIAVWPGVIRPGTRSDAMISFTDFVPTFVELAGGKPPAGIDGRSFVPLLRGTTPCHRSEIFASHTADNNGQMNCYPMRAVRTRQFKYIRNLHPEFSYQTHIDRGSGTDGRTLWDSWVAKAQSDPAAAAVIRRYHQRPVEEIYDVAADPHEIINLAASPTHAATRKNLRAKLDQWMRSMNDEGEVFGIPRPLKDFRIPV